MISQLTIIDIMRSTNRKCPKNENDIMFLFWLSCKPFFFFVWNYSFLSNPPQIFHINCHTYKTARCLISTQMHYNQVMHGKRLMKPFIRNTKRVISAQNSISFGHKESLDATMPRCSIIKHEKQIEGDVMHSQFINNWVNCRTEKATF